jgi:hypothetical protein
MSGKTDKTMSKPKMGMTDKQKDMKKTGTTMTKGSKTMMDTKKGMATDKKMMKPKKMMKDEPGEMMDKKGTTKMK